MNAAAVEYVDLSDNTNPHANRTWTTVIKKKVLLAASRFQISYIYVTYQIGFLTGSVQKMRRRLRFEV
jgi:hypothetical protein